MAAAAPDEVHLRRAQAAAELGRLAVCVRECREALAYDPEAWRPLELMAWAHLELREHDAALAAANRGLTVAAGGAHLHYLASVALHRLGHVHAARLRVDAALALAPEHGVYHARRGRLLLELGERAAAVEAVRTAQGFAPRDPFVLGEVAHVLCETGAAAQGCAIARQRLRNDPDDAWALAGYLRALCAAGGFEEAVAIGAQTIQRLPNQSWVWGLYAEALDEVGRFHPADRAVREALRLAPQTRFGGAALLRVLCEQRRWDEAIATARAFLVRRPGHPRITALLDRALRRGAPAARYAPP